MAGFLDEYGVKDARREKTIKWILISIPVLLILGTFSYFQFRNFAEERQVRLFLEHLREKNYQSAYALWGCTEASPCRDYGFDRFMEDWGPNSKYANAASARVIQSKSCDTGIIQTVSFGGDTQTQLWVEDKSDTIGFAPWDVKQVPPGFVNRLREWMWEATRNCKPLIGP